MLEDWRAWRDPDVPDWIDPIGVLLGRHAGTPKNLKPAIVADGRSVSYAELACLIRQYSGGLSSIGLQPEIRMLLFGTDSLDYVVTWLASVQLGAIPVVVSDLYKQRELLYFLIDTGAQVLFIDGEQLPKLIEISAELPATLKTIVVRGDIPHDLARNFPHQSVVALKTALSAGTTPGKPYIRHANDVAYMFYSGGTTGTAKGITHLAHDFVLIPERHGRFWEYTSDDVVFATSKKYFTHGLWPGVLVPLYWGATLVLDRRPPTPEVVLATLRDQRVTKLITVPTVLKNVIEHLTQTQGAGKVPGAELCRQRFGEDAAGDVRALSTSSPASSFSIPLAARRSPTSGSRTGRRPSSVAAWASRCSATRCAWWMMPDATSPNPIPRVRLGFAARRHASTIGASTKNRVRRS